MANETDPGDSAEPLPARPQGGRPSGQQVDDLNQILAKGAHKFESKSKETKAETTARLKREEQSDAHQLDQQAKDKDLSRRKEWWIFVAFLTLITLMTVMSIVVILLPGSRDDAKVWAKTILTSILAMAAGYLTGKTREQS